MVRWLLMLAVVAPATTLGAQTLSGFKDRQRVLLIFAASERDPRYQQQISLLAEHPAELRERDLVIVPGLDSIGSEPVTVNSLGGLIHVFSASEQAKLRRRFRLPPAQFEVVLVGKDGGSKLRSAVPLSLDKLKQTIDAMPMRQDEIRERRTGK